MSFNYSVSSNIVINQTVISFKNTYFSYICSFYRYLLKKLGTLRHVNYHKRVKRFNVIKFTNYPIVKIHINLNSFNFYVYKYIYITFICSKTSKKFKYVMSTNFNKMVYCKVKQIFTIKYNHKFKLNIYFILWGLFEVSRLVGTILNGKKAFLTSH